MTATLIRWCDCHSHNNCGTVQIFPSSKLVLNTVESCFVALNYYENGRRILVADRMYHPHVMSCGRYHTLLFRGPCTSSCGPTSSWSSSSWWGLEHARTHTHASMSWRVLHTLAVNLFILQKGAFVCTLFTHILFALCYLEWFEVIQNTGPAAIFPKLVCPYLHVRIFVCA